MKFELLDDNPYPIDRPHIHYSYIYAPRAASIRVASAATIFCGKNTLILTPCPDIRRGEWFCKGNYIRCRKDPKFKWKLWFHSCS